MLKRTKIRKYFLALLCAEDVYQDAECGIGPLWLNCDGSTIDINDTSNVQVDDANHSPYSVNAQCAAINIMVNSESGTITPGRFQDNRITFQIDIIVNDTSGHKRQNTLDEISCRILYRMLNTDVIKDVNTGETYKSPICMAKRNVVDYAVRDDSESYGCYSIRQLTFTLEIEECINKGNCGEQVGPLCFDFDRLTTLNKDGPDVFVTLDEE